MKLWYNLEKKVSERLKKLKICGRKDKNYNVQLYFI